MEVFQKENKIEQTVINDFFIFCRTFFCCKCACTLYNNVIQRLQNDDTYTETYNSCFNFVRYFVDFVSIVEVIRYSYGRIVCAIVHIFVTKEN